MVGAGPHRFGSFTARCVAEFLCSNSRPTDVKAAGGRCDSKGRRTDGRDVGGGTAVSHSPARSSETGFMAEALSCSGAHRFKSDKK